jgi:phage recombination protein Bet
MSVAPETRPVTPEEMAVLRGMYPEAKEHHITQLWMFCQRKGLDPITRQVTMSLHWNKKANCHVAAFVTTIDAMRLRAAATGLYAGSDDYEFQEQDGAVRPVKARCTVWRIAGGQRCAFTSTVRWTEFGSNESMWAKMPFHMLGKCAEAQALRKGFPEELSGLYISEEMDQADDPIEKEDAPKSAAALNERTKELEEAPPAEEEPLNPRIGTALAYFKRIGKDEAAVLKHLGYKTAREITTADLDERLHAWAEELKRDAQEAQGNARNAK